MMLIRRQNISRAEFVIVDADHLLRRNQIPEGSPSPSEPDWMARHCRSARRANPTAIRFMCRRNFKDRSQCLIHCEVSRLARTGRGLLRRQKGTLRRMLEFSKTGSKEPVTAHDQVGPKVTNGAKRGARFLSGRSGTQEAEGTCPISKLRLPRRDDVGSARKRSLSLAPIQANRNPSAPEADSIGSKVR